MNIRNKADFEFLEKLFSDFFKKKAIRDKFLFFGDHSVTGWEIWLQIELSCFFEEYSAISKWERESRFFTDKRSEKVKNINIIDFLINEKHKSNNNMLALELKQDYDPSACLRAMVADIKKYNNLKPSELDSIRSFWCLGVHLTIEEDKEQKIYNKHVYEDFARSGFNKKIKGTEFSYTLL